MTAPLDWPKVGEQVVDWNHHAGRLTSVEKITATQIVTPNGVRYRRRDLSRIGATTWAGSRLIRTDDPRWVAYCERERRGRAVHDVQSLAAKARQDNSDLPLLDAYNALTVYLAEAGLLAEASA